MSKQKVFFSFEYNKDAWRAAQIRNVCEVSIDVLAIDCDWEEVRVKSDSAIKEWIDAQIALSTCIVVLIGSTTAYRKWILYEIEKAYELHKGLVGIYVHKIRNVVGDRTGKGKNPFDNVLTHTGEKLSAFVTCYDSPRLSGDAVCKDIAEHMEEMVEKAVRNKAPR